MTLTDPDCRLAVGSIGLKAAANSPGALWCRCSSAADHPGRVGQLGPGLSVGRLSHVMLKRGGVLVVVLAGGGFVSGVGTGAGMDLVDETEVFRVAGNELTHERADDGDLLPALADLVQHASDEFCRYSMVAVGRTDPG